MSAYIVVWFVGAVIHLAVLMWADVTRSPVADVVIALVWPVVLPAALIAVVLYTLKGAR